MGQAKADHGSIHPPYVGASTNHEDTEGEALFKENKGEQAIAPLEREIAAGDNGADKYNYLGLAYYQAGDYKHSIEAFERGMKVEGGSKWALSYNAGNSAFADGNFNAAEGYYSDAYRMNGEFHAALLNRANARLRQDKLVAARDDYALYLERCPESAQADRIKALLALLDEEISDLLPQKLDAAAAVLPVAVPLGGGSEAVEGALPPPSPPPVPEAQAIERETAFLPSAIVTVPEAQAIGRDADISPSLQDDDKIALPAQSEAMDGGTIAAPASFVPQYSNQTQAMDEDAIIAPPAVTARPAAQAQAMEKSSIAAPPDRTTESIQTAAPSEAMGRDAATAPASFVPRQQSQMQEMENIAPPPERKKSANNGQALELDDIAAPPPQDAATQQIQSEEMEEDAFIQ